MYQLGRADPVEGMSAGDNVTFTRVISPSGQSTYRVNRQERSRDEYTKDLEGIGVIARGTNCLVAQGTVKDIGSRNPQAMLELFEQVSGSADLKEEYDAAKAASVAAEEATTALFQNRKEMAPSSSSSTTCGSYTTSRTTSPSTRSATPSWHERYSASSSKQPLQPSGSTRR